MVLSCYFKGISESIFQYLSKVCHCVNKIFVQSCCRQLNRGIFWKGWKGHCGSYVWSTDLKIGAASARNKRAVHFAQLVQPLNVEETLKIAMIWGFRDVAQKTSGSSGFVVRWAEKCQSIGDCLLRAGCVIRKFALFGLGSLREAPSHLIDSHKGFPRNLFHVREGPCCFPALNACLVLIQAKSQPPTRGILKGLSQRPQVCELPGFLAKPIPLQLLLWGSVLRKQMWACRIRSENWKIDVSEGSLWHVYVYICIFIYIYIFKYIYIYK